MKKTITTITKKVIYHSGFNEKFPEELAECIPEQDIMQTSECGSGAKDISFYSESENMSGTLNEYPELPSMPEYFIPKNPIKHAPDLSKLQYPDIARMLKKCGKYDDERRVLIWRYLLSLPLNTLAYENLLKIGIHPAYKNLRKLYPIESQRLFCRTQRLLSALAYWNPILAEVEYLPALVYPFAKVIEHNDLILFETTMSLILHWIYGVFCTFPQPPVQLLQMVENCICREDPGLGNHMREVGFHPIQYVWPLLQSMFSEVMPKSQWVIVIDHIFTYHQHPELIFAIIAAYFLQMRKTYMLVRSSGQLAACVRTMTPIDVKKLIKTAMDIRSQMVCDKCPVPLELPITKPNQGSYPIMEGYTKYVIELGSQIRRQILEKEKDILRQKQLVYDLQKKSQDLLIQEERLRKQQEQALQGERERIAQKTAEAELEIIRHKSMTSKEKVTHIKHMEELENRMNDALKADERLRKLQIDNFKATKDQRNAIRRQEVNEHQELEELKGLELKTTEKISNLTKIRNIEDHTNLESKIQELGGEEVNLRDKQIQDRWRAEDQMEIIKREEWLRDKELEFERKRLEQMREIQEKQEELFKKEKELELAKLEHERRMRKAAEEEVVRRPDIQVDVRASPKGLKSTYFERMPSQDSPQQDYNELSPEEKNKSVHEQPSSEEEKEVTNNEVHIEEHAAIKKKGLPSTNIYSEEYKNTGAGLTGIPQDTFNPHVQTQLRSTHEERYIKGPGTGVINKQIIERKTEYKSHNSDKNQGEDSKLIERHNRVKQQLEELQRRFPTNEQSEPSGSSSIYSSSPNKSPSSVQNHSKYDEVSGTSMSGNSNYNS